MKKKKIPTIETAFDDIVEYIKKDKHIVMSALLNDNGINDNISNSQQVSCMKNLTFYLIAEHKQSEKLADIINMAINNYLNSPNITISKKELNENININLDKIYYDFNIVFLKIKDVTLGFNKEDEDDENEQVFSKSLINNLDIDADSKKGHMIFILNMLYQFVENENRELFLTYIPPIMYLIHANYSKGIMGKIPKMIKRNINKEEIKDIVDFLTKFSANIPKSSTRDTVRKIQYPIKSFIFVSLYTAILTNYRKNFIANFLWFERNVGYYQYYFTEKEYSKIINYISKATPEKENFKMDISIPTALYLNFKNTIPDDNKSLWEILGLIINEKSIADDDIYHIMTEIFEENSNNSMDYAIDYSSIIGYFKSDSLRETYSLKNRFMIHSIQALYYRELLCKENLIKNEFCLYNFHCDEISDNDFKLKDVTFDLWYTSDDTIDIDFKVINDDKYYIVNPAPSINCPAKNLCLDDSIIWIKEAKFGQTRNLFERKNIKNAPLKLDNVNFKNLTITSEYTAPDKNIDLFTSKDIVDSFNKIYGTEPNKIYAFLGLHYFTNIEDYPQGRKNIMVLYVNNLMGYQNFFPIRGTSDYHKMGENIDRYIKNLQISGSTADFSCSKSCGSTCDTSVNYGNLYNKNSDTSEIKQNDEI